MSSTNEIQLLKTKLEPLLLAVKKFEQELITLETSELTKKQKIIKPTTKDSPELSEEQKKFKVTASKDLKSVKDDTASIAKGVMALAGISRFIHAIETLTLPDFIRDFKAKPAFDSSTFDKDYQTLFGKIKGMELVVNQQQGDDVLKKRYIKELPTLKKKLKSLADTNRKQKEKTRIAKLQLTKANLIKELRDAEAMLAKELKLAPSLNKTVAKHRSRLETMLKSLNDSKF